MSGHQRPHGPAHRARPSCHGLCPRHAHESCDADRARARLSRPSLISELADRQGYANGFKPKTLKTRVGRVDLRIPQTRDYRDENGRPFYPRVPRAGRPQRAGHDTCCRRDVRPGRQHPEGHGDRRGALRPRDHLDPGEPGGGRTRRAAQCLARPANRGDHLPHPRCPLRKSPPRRGDRALRPAHGHRDRPRRQAEHPRLQRRSSPRPRRTGDPSSKASSIVACGA